MLLFVCDMMSCRDWPSGLRCINSVTDKIINSSDICQPPCDNGVCNVNTGYCDCSPGYTGPSCSDGKIVSTNGLFMLGYLSISTGRYKRV